MILSLRNNELYFKAFDGDKYKVSLKPTLKVNIHDDVVFKEINLTSIVTVGKIPDGVLTREEMRAVSAYFREWPDSSEKRDACKVIDDALKVEHEKARDRAIMEMSEMYGCRRALTLSDMIRKRSFPYPAYYLREAGVHELIMFLIDRYPGVASTHNEVPKTVLNTVNLAHRCGGSKCAVGVRGIIEKHNLNATRCTAAFRAAHYIEKRNDPIIGR